MTWQSVNERGDPLKTKYPFLTRSDLRVAVQRAGPHLQPFAAGLRLTAIISSLTRLRFSRRVFFVLVTKTPTISVTMSTETQKENSYVTTNHSTNPSPRSNVSRSPIYENR